MAHIRWVHLTRAASAAGLAVFAAYTLLAPTDDAYFTFFNTWVYDGELPYINMAPASARQASIRIRRSAAHQYMADRERPERAA